MPARIKTLIVVPENNSTMEPEISALCPALAPLAVARVKRPPRTLLLEDLPTYAEATLDAIAHEKQVLSGRLGHVALLIEQDRLVVVKRPGSTERRAETAAALDFDDRDPQPGHRGHPCQGSADRRLADAALPGDDE